MEYIFKNYEPVPIKEGHLKLGGKNPVGDELSLNSLYLTKNGKPFLPVMGEMHYSRCARDMWLDELAKMKAGGVTIVSTYVLWIYHEETEGEYDFSGDNDLRAFVLACKRVGLDVIVRVGPWCHAEVRNGGLPDWVLDKPFKLRENNPEYLELITKWYKRIAKELEGLYYKDGGNIIGVQIENEYTHNAEHLKTLKYIAKDCGMEVPYYTVTGWNSAAGAKIPTDEVLPVFGGYCDAPWDYGIKENAPSKNYIFSRMRNDNAIGKDLIEQVSDDGWRLPYDDYPFATCELGGGLESTHHRRYILTGMDIYALSLVKLASGNNLIGYYMYHGGTNKIGKHSTLQESTITGYPNDYPILSYDFQAPLSEYGEVREQYRLLNMLHMFVADFGEAFAPMQTVEAEIMPDQNDTSSLRMCMRTDGKSGFVFVSHYQRLRKLDDIFGAVTNTGTVEFPPIDVVGDTAFFMPFNMDINGHNLEYATAQPLCRVRDKYFFAEIPGIKPEYKIAPEIRDKYIVTLSWDEARFARKLDGELFIGDGCDLYVSDGASVRAVRDDKPYAYRVWNGEGFEQMNVSLPDMKAEVKITDAREPRFKKPYAYELNMGGGRHITWKKVEVSGAAGFIELDYVSDVMQIYVDGELKADIYYLGTPWRLPAAMLCGHECYLAYSELLGDCYREFK